MPIHGSTQMSIHNLEGVLELQDLGFKRVVLARELPLNEIQYICKNSKIEIETFYTWCSMYFLFWSMLIFQHYWWTFW